MHALLLEKISYETLNTEYWETLNDLSAAVKTIPEFQPTGCLHIKKTVG